MKEKNKKTVHLPILVEQDEDNIFIVSCPTLNSCHSYGKTIDEAIGNINEVISMGMKEIFSKEINFA